MSDPELTVDLLSAEHLDAWLADHPDAGDAWLVRWKKGRGPYVGNEDLVCVLLAHGWIDGRAGSLDDDRWRTLISPRRPGSGWSRINKDRVERLLAEGRMRPAGLAAVERAKADGSWSHLDAAESLAEPADLAEALDAVPAARAGWDGFPPSARKVMLQWVTTAKRAETRERRVRRVVDEAAEGRRAQP